MEIGVNRDFSGRGGVFVCGREHLRRWIAVCLWGFVYGCAGGAVVVPGLSYH